QPSRVTASSTQPAADRWLDLALVEADIARRSGQLLRDHCSVQDAIRDQLSELEGGKVQRMVPLVHRRLRDALHLTMTGRVRVGTGTIKFGLGNRIDLFGFDPVGRILTGEADQPI